VNNVNKDYGPTCIELMAVVNGWLSVTLACESEGSKKPGVEHQHGFLMSFCFLLLFFASLTMAKNSVSTLFLLLLLSCINCNSLRGIDVVDVMAFGATGDGLTDDTDAIRKALIHSGPSTIIWFPPYHVFLSQPLNLTSHTTLQVDGILKSLNRESSWSRLSPLENYNTSEDGPYYLQYQAFLYASRAHHVNIFGLGEIDGSGDWWWNAFAAKDHTLKAGRPNLIQFVHCQFIEIAHVLLRDAPFWCVHPVLSQHVHIHHVTIRARTYAPNSDGIDPDSCQHVLIEHNDVGCGDDHVAIKAGRCGGDSASDHLHCATDDRFRNGMFATDNVTVRFNVFRNGMGIAVGSESSGSIRNVDIYNNTVGVCLPGSCETCCGWGPALHVKTTLSRGGILENISFRSNLVYNTTRFILLEAHYQTHDDAIPKDYAPVQIRNISFVRNRALGTGLGAYWDCSPLDPCHEITVMDNYIAASPADNPWTCRNIKSFEVSGNYPAGLTECMEESMNQSTSWVATTV
jgi:polygalacturonase